MNIQENKHLKKRLNIAREFIKGYVKQNPEIDGAVMVGSTNIGFTDKHADIDILVFVSPEAVARRKSAGKGYNETYVEKGVEICIDWHSLSELEKEITDWKNDGTLWSLGKAKTLFDREGSILRLLENIRPYPKKIRQKKLFLHFYWLSYYLNIIETSIERREFETAAFHIYSSVKEVSEILFLIENQFIPIEKWLFHDLSKLRLGQKLLPKIRELMCIAKLRPTELKAKRMLLEEICRGLKRHLLKAGVQKEKIGPDWWKFEPDWNVG